MLTMDHQQISFVCPINGNIDQDKVNFLCNRCGAEKTLKVGNSYICPECLEPDAKLECRLCGSKKVVMDIENKENILNSQNFS